MKVGKMMKTRQDSHLLAQKVGWHELCSAFQTWVLVSPWWLTFHLSFKLDVNFVSFKLEDLSKMQTQLCKKPLQTHEWVS